MATEIHRCELLQRSRGSSNLSDHASAGSIKSAAQMITPNLPNNPLDQVALAVLGWVFRAQDSTDSGGVAARYDLRLQAWQSPYPETTGYLIPTLSKLIPFAENKKEVSERVVSMARFLRSRQTQDGAIDCSRSEKTRKPAAIAFDLAAILNGLCSAAEQSEELLSSADLLTSFLLKSQAADGSFPSLQYFSYFGSHNSLVGYSLLRAGTLLNRSEATEAGLRTLELVSSSILPNGNFLNSSFDLGGKNSSFIHAFCYAIEGIQKSQLLLEATPFNNIEPSLRSLARYASKYQTVPAIFSRNFRPTTWFSAGTGLAQTSLVLGLSDNEEYQRIGRRKLEMLANRIRTSGNRDGVRGGVPSSIPIFGNYGRFTYNNWGAKYFLDSWMLHTRQVRVP